MGGYSFDHGAYRGPGWALEAPEVRRALLQEVGYLSPGYMGRIAAGLAEGSAGSQSYGSIMAMHPGGSPGSALGYTAGVIKPSRVVLAVLVGVMLAWGVGEAHLLAGCQEQGINCICFCLGISKGGGLRQAC